MIHTNIKSVNDLSIVENLIYPVFRKKNDQNKLYWEETKKAFLTAMKNAGLDFIKRYILWLYVNRTITNGVKQGIPLIEVEEKLRKFLRNRTAHHNHEEDLRILTAERVKRSFRLIEPYIIGEKILDLGAGDGRLALEIKQQLNKDILLVDILDYNDTDLPLILYDPKKEVPLGDKTIDTTILYTVLHHASDPGYLLREASRITTKRLIIIEGYIEEEAIRMSNSFFDWFYNRVIGDEDINVPLNFLKVKDWEEKLKSNDFNLIKTVNIGLYDPVVPEHQVLLVADHN